MLAMTEGNSDYELGGAEEGGRLVALTVGAVYDEAATSSREMD